MDELLGFIAIFLIAAFVVTGLSLLGTLLVAFGVAALALIVACVIAAYPWNEDAGK